MSRYYFPHILGHQEHRQEEKSEFTCNQGRGLSNFLPWTVRLNFNILKVKLTLINSPFYCMKDLKDPDFRRERCHGTHGANWDPSDRLSPGQAALLQGIRGAVPTGFQLCSLLLPRNERHPQLLEDGTWAEAGSQHFSALLLTLGQIMSHLMEGR